ncbi:MAG: DNA cytosine methyltransferase [Actinobacteria bacterium]|nr:DNA cytosine methyltransferase [Actinomycetota bacterium]
MSSILPPPPASGQDSQGPMTVLDLFAGAGGFSEAFRQAGFDIVGAVEFDRAAAATYAANFGPIVAAMPIQEWLATGDVPQVDVVVGGPPCQGFSQLGLQDPEDERSKLWSEYVETVLRARPKYFVLENVGAFTKAPEYGGLSAEVGPDGRLQHYRFIATVLNAADYGAAQARRRAIFIGYRKDLPQVTLPPATHAAEPVTVRQAFARRKVRRRVEYVDLALVVQSKRPDGLPGPYTSRQLHVDRLYSTVSKARFRCIPPGGNRHDLPIELQAPCWRGFTKGASDVMGRLHWDKPSVTIRTEFTKPEKGRYLHPSEDRALTLYEGAVLQGFPDSYKWVGSRTDIARQIGNAVPIDLGRAIAEQLVYEASAAADQPPLPAAC